MPGRLRGFLRCLACQRDTRLFDACLQLDKPIGELPSVISCRAPGAIRHPGSGLQELFVGASHRGACIENCGALLCLPLGRAYRSALKIPSSGCCNSVR